MPMARYLALTEWYMKNSEKELICRLDNKCQMQYNYQKDFTFL